MLKSHEVRASLQRSVPHLSRDHETIVRGLQADGICATGATDAINASAAPGGLRILSLHAAAEADPLKAHLVRRVMTMARSMGVTLNAESPIDPYALSAELKAAGASLNDRMQLKSALATLGCL